MHAAQLSFVADDLSCSSLDGDNSFERALRSRLLVPIPRAKGKTSNLFPQTTDNQAELSPPRSSAGISDDDSPLNSFEHPSYVRGLRKRLQIPAPALKAPRTNLFKLPKEGKGPLEPLRKSNLFKPSAPCSTPVQPLANNLFSVFVSLDASSINSYVNDDDEERKARAHSLRTRRLTQKNVSSQTSKPHTPSPLQPHNLQHCAVQVDFTDKEERTADIFEKVNSAEFTAELQHLLQHYSQEPFVVGATVGNETVAPRAELDGETDALGNRSVRKCRLSTLPENGAQIMPNRTVRTKGRRTTKARAKEVSENTENIDNDTLSGLRRSKRTPKPRQIKCFEYMIERRPRLSRTTSRR